MGWGPVPKVPRRRPAGRIRGALPKVSGEPTGSFLKAFRKALWSLPAGTFGEASGWLRGSLEAYVVAGYSMWRP